MLLRIDDVAVIVVLDDSNALNSVGVDKMWKIKGALSPLQLREIAVRTAVHNLLLAERPFFSSEMDLEYEECAIVAHPTTRYSLCRAYGGKRGIVGSDDATPLRTDDPEGPEKDYIMEQMGTGHYTFLLDEQGEFRADHMDVINPENSG